MTPEEVLLWRHLRSRRLGVTFRRQEPMGRYVADFVCYERALVIELDGSQHLNSQTDQERDADMAEYGFQTLRFWNNEVRNNLPGVLHRIQQVLEARKNL
ncbi:endonuclease domain-containing protein [Deinococcus sp. YIM 134068]|uniref:endonuclease domain-containing protein n=1 Tax=Deinococcus lichenicola TaxID=3118910 RepID=UPI002F93FE81